MEAFEEMEHGYKEEGQLREAIARARLAKDLKDDLEEFLSEEVEDVSDEH